MNRLDGKFAVVTGGTQGLDAEVARAVAYLSSEESGLMTGATINLDQSIWGAYEDTPHPKAAI